MPIRDVTDTQAFTNALEAWHSLVLTAGARNTPRTAKRFQNRVRYLAMRQRATQLGQALSNGERLLRKIYKAKPTDSLVEQPVVIPEPFLVAFAAIDEFQPDWLHDPDKFRRIVLPAPGSEKASGPIEVQQLPVLQKAKRDANWVSISNFEDCRNAYFILSSEVEKRVSAS